MNQPRSGEPPWLAIGRELRAIAETGLAFLRDPFDRQRFERIRELAAARIRLQARDCRDSAVQRQTSARPSATRAMPAVSTSA
jgi:hypothetical protein